MLKILVDYPLHDEELTVVHRSLQEPPELVRVLSLDDLRALQRTVASVYVDPGIVSYAVTLATATRRPSEFGAEGVDEYVAYGASPRGPISLVQAARALAVLRGLRHRLVLTYQALAEERPPDAILDAVLDVVPTPQLDLARQTAA
jgi:MoxR-like ATPase